MTTTANTFNIGEGVGVSSSNQEINITSNGAGGVPSSDLANKNYGTLAWGSSTGTIEITREMFEQMQINYERSLIPLTRQGYTNSDYQYTQEEYAKSYAQPQNLLNGPNKPIAWTNISSPPQIDLQHVRIKNSSNSTDE